MSTYPDQPLRPRSERDRFGRRRDARWVALLLLLTPLFVLPYGTVHLGWMIALGAAAGGIAAAALFSVGETSAPPRPVSLTLGFGAALLVAMALPFVPISTEARLALLGQLAVAGPTRPFGPLAITPYEGLWTWVFYVEMFLVFAASLVLFGSERRIKRLARVVVLTAVGVAAIALVQRTSGVSTVYGLGYGEASRAFGPFIYRNAGAVYCALALPLALALSRTSHQRASRPLWSLAAFVLLVAILLGQSRGAALTAGAVLLAFSALLGGWTAVTSLGLVSLAGLWVLVVGPHAAFAQLSEYIRADSTMMGLTGGREQIVAEASRLLREVPWLGVGPAGFGDAFRWAKTSPSFAVVDHAHNDVVQMLVEHGILVGGLAVISCVALLGLLFRGAVRDPAPFRRTFLAAAFASGCGLAGYACVDFPIRFGAIAFVASMLAGAGMSLLYSREPNGGARVRRHVRGGTTGLVAAALLAAAVAGSQRDDATSLYGSAERSMRLAETLSGDAAARLYEAALMQRPFGTDAPLRLSAIAARSKHWEEAEHWLRLEARRYPTSPWAWLNLARLLSFRNRQDEARDAWRALFLLDLPAGLDARTLLEEALRSEPAVLAAALDVVPRRRALFCPAGLVVEALGDADGAEFMLRAALADEPGCAYALVYFYLRQSKAEDAEALLRDREPSCETDFARSVVARQRGLAKQSRAYVESAFQLCGAGWPALRFELARARIADGDRSGLLILDSLLGDYDETAVRRTLAAGYHDFMEYEAAVPHLEWLVSRGMASPEEASRLAVYRGASP